jgi:hypothetical protein
MATFRMDQQAQRPGSVGKAVLAGIAVAIAGSLVWGLIAYTTKYQLSLMALLIGLGVATVVVRVAGGKRSPGLAVICAALAVFGCALGSLVAEILVLAGHGIPVSLIMAHLNLVAKAYPSAVGGLGFIFWALGALYGYRIAMGAPVWGRRAPRPGLPPPAGQPYGQWGGTTDAEPAAAQPYGQWGGTTAGEPAAAQPYGQWPQPGGTVPGDPAATGQPLFFSPPPEPPAAGADPAASPPGPTG